MELNVEEMASILVSGGKMLSQHCPTCHAPLFEVKGQILCPKCEKTISASASTPKKENIVLKKPIESGKSAFNDSITQIISCKINELVVSLRNENDPEKILKLLQAIDQALIVCYRLKNNGDINGFD